MLGLRLSRSLGLLLDDSVLLEETHDLSLLVEGLEASVTVLGGSVNELDVELLSLPGLGGWEDGLSEDEWSLLGTSNTSLDKNEVLIDNTVVWEATHWGDVLVNGISIGSGVIGDTTNSTGTNSVDLLVELGSAVVAHLTASGNSPLNGSWMPGSDTGDLSETSMCLTLESLDTESLDDTLGSLTLGDTNEIDALVLLEDLRDLDLLLELALGEVNLIGDGTSVKLDLHDLGLVLSELELADLGGADHSDNGAVLLDAVEVLGDWSVGSLLVSLGILGEGSLLGSGPVLVESSLDILVELLGPDGGEGTESSWGLEVADDTNDLHWWALDNRAGMYPISLDELLTLTTLLDLDNVGHTGLVTAEGSKVDLLLLVVAWEGSNASSVVSGSSLWKVGQGTKSWVLVLSV